MHLAIQNSRPTEDRFLMSRDELKNKIAVLLGGRAAETLIYGHLSTRASDDISRATDVARNMMTRYGIDEELGSVAYETQEGANHLVNAKVVKEYSEKTAFEIDDSVRQIIEDDGNRTLQILKDNRKILERTATALLNKETLDQAELRALTDDLRLPAAPAL